MPAPTSQLPKARHRWVPFGSLCLHLTKSFLGFDLRVPHLSAKLNPLAQLLRHFLARSKQTRCLVSLPIAPWFGPNHCSSPCRVPRHPLVAVPSRPRPSALPTRQGHPQAGTPVVMVAVCWILILGVGWVCSVGSSASPTALCPIPPSRAEAFLGREPIWRRTQTRSPFSERPRPGNGQRVPT
jgi:hypothetical protein